MSRLTFQVLCILIAIHCGATLALGSDTKLEAVLEELISELDARNYQDERAVVTDAMLQAFLVSDPTEDDLAAARARLEAANAAVSPDAETEFKKLQDQLSVPDPSPTITWPVDSSIDNRIPAGETAVDIKRDLKSQDDLLRDLMAELEIVGSRDLISGLIQLFTSTLSTATALKLLADLSSGGCTNEASICTDKKAIKQLLEDIDEQTKLLNDKHRENVLGFIDVRRNMNENLYLLYFTNKSAQHIIDIGETAEDFKMQRDTMLPVLKRLATAPVNGKVSMNAVFGSIDTSSDTVERILELASNDEFGKVISSEAAKRGFTSLVGGVFHETLQTIVSDNDLKDQPELQVFVSAADAFERSNSNAGQKVSIEKLISGLDGVKQSMTSGLVSETLDKMVKGPSEFFTLKQGAVTERDKSRKFQVDLYGNLGSAVEGIKAFDAMVDSRAFDAFYESIRHIKQNFASSSWGPIRSMGAVLAKSLGAVVSVTGDIMSIVKNDIIWAEVAEKLAAARAQYEAHLASLKSLIVKADQQSTTLVTQRASVITAFKSLGETFRLVLNNAAGLDTLIANGQINAPMLREIYFYDVNDGNVKVKQAVVRQAMHDVMDKLSNAREVLRVTSHVTQSARSYQSQTRPVSDMLPLLQTALASSAVPQLKQFAPQFSTKDLVCQISFFPSNPNADHYDGFSLIPFREYKCNIADNTWSQIQNEALNLQFEEYLKAYLSSSVTQGKYVTDMVDSVRHTLTSQTTSKFAPFVNTLNAKPIVCAVAKLTTAAKYDFYELSNFRNKACSAISNAEFDALQQNAALLRTKSNDVASFVDLCKNRQFCLCFQSLGITEAEFLELAPKSEAGFKYCVSAHQKPCDTDCVTLA